MPEVYKSQHTTATLRVYFLSYSKSVEEQRYLSEVRRETEAFKTLIENKATMVVPEGQVGRDSCFAPYVSSPSIYASSPSHALARAVPVCLCLAQVGAVLGLKPYACILSSHSTLPPSLPHCARPSLVPHISCFLPPSFLSSLAAWLPLRPLRLPVCRTASLLRLW